MTEELVFPHSSRTESNALTLIIRKSFNPSLSRFILSITKDATQVISSNKCDLDDRGKKVQSSDNVSIIHLSVSRSRLNSAPLIQ